MTISVNACKQGMKKGHVILILLVAALAATTLRTYATTFCWSYVFGNGIEVSGSLDGTQNGNLVQDILNVKMFINGTPVPGPLIQYSRPGNPPLGLVLGGAVVSFDDFQNNFLFANGDIFTSSDNAYFSIVPNSNPGSPPPVANVFSATLGISHQEFITSGAWSFG